MRFATFLLDDWLNHYKYADPPIEFDMASSTGPIWTFRELLELDPTYSLENLLGTQLVYTRVEGTKALCESIAEMEGVQPEDVQVTTGAAEALLLLFTLAAEPGANVLVPSLGVSRASMKSHGASGSDNPLLPSVPRKSIPS